MIDLSFSEMLVIAVVAILVIGPKDLPLALSTIGKWMGKARGLARQFRMGMDDMVREAELKEMERKWAEQNARIMAEHPPESFNETNDAPPISAPADAPDDPPPPALEAQAKAEADRAAAHVADVPVVDPATNTTLPDTTVPDAALPDTTLIAKPDLKEGAG